MKTTFKTRLVLLAALSAPLPVFAQALTNPFQNQCNWADASRCDMAYAYSCSNGDQSACDRYNTVYADPGKEITTKTPFEDTYRQSKAYMEQQANANQVAASNKMAAEQAAAQNAQFLDAFKQKQEASLEYSNSDGYKQKTAGVNVGTAQEDDDNPCAIILCMSQLSVPKECKKPIKKWESIRKYNHHGFDSGRTKAARAKKLYSCKDALGKNKAKVDTIIETYGWQPHIIGQWTFR